MRILTVASRKGGSGKTTLAGHLAVEAQRSGSGLVALIDTDPQGSLAEWWNARRSPMPVYIQTCMPALQEDLERTRAQGVDLAIVDTPPALSARVSQAIALSDLVLVPARPSPHDLRSIGGTADLIAHHGKPLTFVLNGATKRARITAEAVDVLSDYGPLVPTIVHHRVDYAASMIDGRTVMEIPGAQAASDEISELWEHLSDRLAMAPTQAAPTYLPAVACGA